MVRHIFTVALCAVVLAGCTPTGTALFDRGVTSGDGGPTGAKDAPHPVSIEGLIAKDISGTDFTVGPVLATTDTYTRYYITYQSGDLKISGIMNVPAGTGPFPVLILNHGYIDPAIYTNGRGLKREQDYLARRGYVVIHPDYRNHAESDKDSETELHFRLGYTEDVIAAVKAVAAANLEYIDASRVGMLGHSMGGGVSMNAMVVAPDLIDAVVLFAPVSADFRLNFERWTRSRAETAQKIIELYGTPTSSPEFWDGISVHNYFDRVTAPVQLHHGTADESVPIVWSDQLVTWLKQDNVSYEYYVYPDEPHEFINAWPQVMARTVEFFNIHVKN